MCAGKVFISLMTTSEWPVGIDQPAGITAKWHYGLRVTLGWGLEVAPRLFQMLSIAQETVYPRKVFSLTKIGIESV